MTRAGLNLIQQALSIYDRDLRLAVCNRPFQTMFGLPEWLVTPGAPFEDTIRFLVETGEYGEVADPEDFVTTRVDQARAFVPHYMERRRANGRMISVEGSPLPEGGWVTVYTDITAIKSQEALLRARSEELSDQLLTRAEELARTNRQLESTIAQLEEAKRGLAEMEARTRLVTEMTPAHIGHVDTDGIYTFTNRRLSSVLPGRSNDIVGQPFDAALGVKTANRLRDNLNRALQGESGVLEFTDEESGRRIRTAFTPDRVGEDGPINGVYSLSTDVTEEAQARAVLTQTHKRELAAQLTSGLAHDFSNLLTIILGLQSRLHKLDLPAEARELTDATCAAARRGGTLLDRIAKISGRHELHPVPVDMRRFFDTFAALARAPLPDNIRLSITQSIPDELLMLDEGSLQDSLLNLVLNARDAINADGGEIRIRAHKVRDTWLDIVVEDTGPGFTREALDYALDPFFTTKGQAGSGLGLSMVFDFAKLSGGNVTLENHRDGGARVTYRLPLRPVPEAAAKPLLVLLVEDMPDLRVSVREMLTGLGHQVIEAESAAEAEQLADLPAIDMVLTDIKLAGHVTGVDLLDRIAGRRPDLRLALMTSLPECHPLRRRGAARWPVLSKPFDGGRLHALLLRGDAA
ncbi:response regulator [Rhodobacteraceae bacterium W635]|nr:response regulator [Rhodobacteraceae bacterium W635]